MEKSYFAFDGGHRVCAGMCDCGRKVRGSAMHREVEGGVNPEGARGLIVSYHTGCLVNCTVNPAGVSVEQLGNSHSHQFPNEM